MSVERPPSARGVRSRARFDRRRGRYDRGDCQGERAREVDSRQLHSRTVRQPREPPARTTKRPVRRSGRDTDGRVDIFVAGAGTGGTISGTGRYLKRMNPDVKIVAFEPSGSPYLTEAEPERTDSGNRRGLQADNLDLAVIDEVLTIDDDDAYKTGAALAKSEGILVGITSGARGLRPQSCSPSAPKTRANS